ncbi:MAG: hypothetical protein EBX40_02965 [Gammaproteobacteria bacterium]|nr:hypothetical protein [Gammaproteobacteria bacterium]
MNITPVLEKLLLSNEAEFKIATLGLNGGNTLVCPNGKSLVILEVCIQPFANYYDDENNILFTEGVSRPNYKLMYELYWSKRQMYQMQICNDKYNQHLTFTNAFKTAQSIAPDPTLATIEIQFFEKREALFIYADRSMYFNFFFYDPENNGIQYTQDPFSSSFQTRIQNEPNYPITNLNNPNTWNYETYENSTKTLAYYPQTKEQTFSAIPPAAPGQSEGFRLVNDVNPQDTVYDGNNAPGQFSFTARHTFIMPAFNVKYALINKRPTDKGIL